MIEDSVYFQSDGKTPSGYAGVAVWSGTRRSIAAGPPVRDDGEQLLVPPTR